MSASKLSKNPFVIKNRYIYIIIEFKILVILYNSLYKNKTKQTGPPCKYSLTVEDLFISISVRFGFGRVKKENKTCKQLLSSVNISIKKIFKIWMQCILPDIIAPTVHLQHISAKNK